MTTRSPEEKPQERRGEKTGWLDTNDKRESCAQNGIRGEVEIDRGEKEKNLHEKNRTP